MAAKHAKMVGLMNECVGMWSLKRQAPRTRKDALFSGEASWDSIREIIGSAIEKTFFQLGLDTSKSGSREYRESSILNGGSASHHSSPSNTCSITCFSSHKLRPIRPLEDAFAVGGSGKS